MWKTLLLIEYLNRFKNYDFKKKFNSIIEISPIRFQKLLHMGQDAILMSVLGFFLGKFINDLFPKLDKDKPKYQITIELIIHLFLMLVVIFYLIKIINFIPFLFSFGNYSLVHRSKDGENSILMASTVAIALVFNATQTNLKDKVMYLTDTQKYLVKPLYTKFV